MPTYVVYEFSCVLVEVKEPEETTEETTTEEGGEQ